ncbi:MAG: acyl-CoA thioesterase [Syntrophomonas sp.]
MEAKPASASSVTMTQIVLPFQTNVAGNMHGGEVMKLMDSAAGVVAQRHSLCNVVTASVTNLSFLEPIFLGDLVICNAELRYAGKTSMEVYVCVKAENLNRGEIKPVVEGYFFMVALDRNGRPATVPPLKLENDEQRMHFEEAQARINYLKSNRK